MTSVKCVPLYVHTNTNTNERVRDNIHHAGLERVRERERERHQTDGQTVRAAAAVVVAAAARLIEFRADENGTSLFFYSYIALRSYFGQQYGAVRAGRKRP